MERIDVFFFRRPPPSPVASEALSPNFTGVVSSRAVEVAKQKLPTLAQHGDRIWEKALSYAHDFVRDGSDIDLSATLILRVSRDFEVSQLRNGREVPIRHPAFAGQAKFLNEREKPIPFEKVMAEGLSRSDFDKISLYPENGELIVKSPSGRWKASVGPIIPKPWYDALVMVGKHAMGGRDLDRYSYHAKVHLLGEGDPFTEELPSRMMTQPHRLKSNEIRFFKGDPERWQRL